MITVRPRLSKILSERNMTQTVLAEQAGIPQAAVSRFDKSTQHKDEHLFRISRALGLSIEDLYEVIETS
ncbi:helix-turn-helix domain-containing protein [Paenibacillus sp. MMS18-CY102]|uniref:helix-turn-helix domain-containing protein n=1 Tax=Paenibacillus sp. MMS18-CY102 TaxID=2682849 RepID=UPI0019224A0B|nr:helix-turn-helix transcriptional regulator [Paenibacillus sp. MMS18-CY102]